MEGLEPFTSECAKVVGSVPVSLFFVHFKSYPFATITALHLKLRVMPFMTSLEKYINLCTVRASVV